MSKNQNLKKKMKMIYLKNDFLSARKLYDISIPEVACEGMAISISLKDKKL